MILTSLIKPYAAGKDTFIRHNANNVKVVFIVDYLLPFSLMSLKYM